MILGDGKREVAGSRTTLDDLFRRAGVRRAGAVALIDPPNRESFTDGTPRQLTYAQADHAISAFAARLRGLGLQTDAVIAIQLPHTVESVIALLGVLRAGMIAAQLPLLWRKQDMVAALGRTGAKAIVTSTRIGATDHAEIAMQAAAELFPIRHICAFGHDLPDGIVPLDDVFAPVVPLDFVPSLARSGNAADHVAVISFDTGVGGAIPVARNHVELIAGGIGPHLESGGALDRNILSAIPFGSFAGLALGMMPWLLGGGTLALHHPFDPDVFGEQCRAQDGGIIVLPGPALAPLAEAKCLAGNASTIVALWRSPERLASSAHWHGEATLVDVASFGEVGLLATRRGAEGAPAPIPCGVVGAPHGAPNAVTIAKIVRTAAGTLALRGPMVPAHTWSPGGDPQLTIDAAGFVDTGFGCHIERNSQTLTLAGPPGGVTTVGGYRFRQNEVDWLVADADLDAIVVALPDAYLNQRLAGSAPDRTVTAAELEARGINQLIAGSFRPRNGANAA